MSVQALSCAMIIRGVSASEKLLLLVLANYADDKMTCWPSHKRLADDTCLSQRTVLTLMRALEEKRIITRTERQRQDGSRTSDVITLYFSGEVVSPPPETISPRGESSAVGVGKPLQGGGEVVSPLTTFEPSVNHQSEPPVLVAQSAPRPPAEDTVRGSRLPEEWLPPRDYVAADFGLSHEEHAAELAKFRDYWRSVPGAKGRKTDWPATWRNWMRRASENSARKAPNDRPDDKFTRKQANLSRAFAASHSVAGLRGEP